MLLRALGAADLLTQAADGLLLLGLAGDRLVNHYTFYAAFRSAQEFRLVARGRTLGSLPVDYPLMPGSLLIFGGHRWKVIAVDTRAKIVELVRSSGGRPPKFTGSGGEVADRVRQEMLSVYMSSNVPAYLDPSAARLLAEGRANFIRFGLDSHPVVQWGADTLIFPWRGDRIISTLATALTTTGVDVEPDGICLTMANASPAEAITRLTTLATSGPADPLRLAASVQTKIVEKYDDFLNDKLLDIAYASRSLDIGGAWHSLTSLLSEVAGQTRAAVQQDA